MTVQAVLGRALSGSCSAGRTAVGCQQPHTGHAVQQLQWLWPLAVSDRGARGRVARVHRGWVIDAVAAHRLRRAAVHRQVRSRATHPQVHSVQRVPSMCVSMVCRFMLALPLLLLHGTDVSLLFVGLNHLGSYF